MFHLYKVERHGTGKYQSAMMWIEAAIEPAGGYFVRERAAILYGWDANMCEAHFIGAFDTMEIPKA